MKNLYRILSIVILLNLMFIVAAAQKLEGDWKLVEARQNGRRVSLGREIRTTLMFGEANRLSGNAGCNRYSTTYLLRGRNRIGFQPIISTKMACSDNNFMKQESTFFNIIEKVGRYNIRGNFLVFSDSSERNVLRFARSS